VEQRIKELSNQLLRTEDPQQLRNLSCELQVAIHQHIEGLREKLTELQPALTDSSLIDR